MIKKSIDGKVRFYEKSHKYKLKNKQLTSVTTFIKDFFKPFNEKDIAHNLCTWHPKYKKLGVRKTIQMWRESAEHGTRTHFILESFIKSFFCPEFKNTIWTSDYEDRDFKKARHAEKFLTHYLKSSVNPKPLSEVIIYNEELGLAGQIDLLIERNESDDSINRVVDLIDFKTNNKIDKKAYKNEKAFEPIQDLDDCNFVKYTLQLSIYAYMLEKQGYIIGNLTLLHLQEDKCVPMHIKYEKELVEKLLKWQNNKN